MPTDLSLKEWMDRRGLKTADVLESLGIEEQTLRNWRSGGVPKRRHQFVRDFMEKWDRDKGTAPPPTASITLEVDQEVFDEWCRAALEESKIIREWLIDAANQYARGHFQVLESKKVK